MWGMLMVWSCFADFCANFILQGEELYLYLLEDFYKGEIFRVILRQRKEGMIV